MVVRRAKRTQHCTFCKNHGLVEPKKGHQCPYVDCPCLLCKLTKKAQVAMRHQQRFWRHQKQKLKNQSEEENSAAAGEKTSKGQACDKCRNHNEIRPKRNHECPYNNCDCEYCSLTFTRREIMKHQQRVRRSRIMSLKESESNKSPVEKSIEDEEVDEDDEEKNVDGDQNDVDGARISSPLHPAVDSPKVDDSAQDYASPAPKVEQKEVEPLQSLSVQFSSLESEYPVSPQESSKLDINNQPVDVVDTRIPSPPPLLPIETEYHCFPEVDLPKSVHYPYGYVNEECTTPVQIQKDMYHERERFSEESPLMGSSQISTVMLFQNGYSSTSHSHYFPTPHVQQVSSSLKISLDPAVNPAIGGHFGEIPYRNSGRYQHTGLSSSFSNISQSSAMFPHQRQHPFQRRPRDHSVRLLPYFAYPSTNHQ